MSTAFATIHPLRLSTHMMYPLYTEPLQETFGMEKTSSDTLDITLGGMGVISMGPLRAQLGGSQAWKT
jgi:hypothetical protein